MEKRQSSDRRQIHLYVSEDRRGGPHDRRGMQSRQSDLAAEQAKIERIRAFKARDRATSSSGPHFTTRQLILMGICFLVAALVLLIMN